MQPSSALTAQVDALQNELFEDEVARLDAMHRAEQTQALVDRQMEGLQVATQEYGYATMNWLLNTALMCTGCKRATMS